MLLIAGYLLPIAVNASNLDLATKPLYTGTSEAPMMMLTMGRDHTLFYEAYNDASDLDGDGELDTTFKPDYTYEGYFDSTACYKYRSNKSRFKPKTIETVCSNNNHWSGNFLNYLTMTRMDVLRKVLYGGTRSTDDEDETILERVFIPQDAHSWAKAYTSVEVDGYDISDYTPYSLPDSGKQHFFGTVTYSGLGEDPILRVRENISYSSDDWGVWSWASTERPVLDASGDDYVVRVEACVDGFTDGNNCDLYPSGNYKPTGLLHDYGETDQMLFGLLTGSYNKNLSGGVLRRAISEFSEEVDSDTGQFTSTEDGIVATIDKLRIHGFNYSNKTYATNCGWVVNGAISDGQCASWGNPAGEMLYEAMRYYSGVESASPSYATSGSYDAEVGLTSPDWDDPFEDRGTCANPNVLLISDISPSYDSDQLPGVYSEFTKSANNDEAYDGTTLPGFSVSELLETISTSEGKTSGQFFIGQSGTDNDGAPTAKDITGLESVRGLAPAEPTKKGSYSSAAVAYYGHRNDIHLTKDEDQNVTTMVVALASTLPEIEVDVDGEVIKIVPFAKSVGWGNKISADEGDFQPTNSIIDWYIESITDTKGVFRINYEDVEQGADHDMDMIVKYTYEVKEGLCKTYDSDGDCTETAKGVEITLDSTYAAGGVDQHAGYIISGTTNDGMYLEVKDVSGANIKYYLDTPDSTVYDNRDISGSTSNLGLYATRNFFPSDESAADFLPSPLWYAAKWGGFTDSDGDGTPNLDSEWDTSGADDGGADGDPDNYFPVTNAGELKDQLAAAFDLAYDGLLTGASATYSSNLLSSGSLAYQSSFEEETWNGDVNAYQVSSDGEYASNATWSAATQLDAMDPDNRHIYTRSNESSLLGSQGAVFEFTTSAISTTLLSSLTDSLTSVSTSTLTDSFSESQLFSLLGDVTGSTTEKLAYLTNVVGYIRGDRDNEVTTVVDGFRERSSVLGDIVNASPYYVSSAKDHTVATEVVAFAANDGMVHIVDADDGKELAAYIPSGVYDALGNLVDSAYIHEYSVDGGLNAYSDENDLIDVDINGVSTEVARTTLVGRLGLGVKGLYAIDVSDISNPTTDMMRWEITTDTDGFEGLGLSVSEPTIVELANGKASVVFANGYNSTDDEGAIYIADLTDGSLIKRLTVGVQTDPTGEDRPNALAQPLLVDNNSDGIADYLYAGDLFGNMWAFDISSEDPSEWGIKKTAGAPLFTALSPTLDNQEYMSQPITSRPSVVRHPDGEGVLIAFGTGKYVESDDTSADDQATQSFYVVEDNLGSAVVTAVRSSSGFSNLQKQSITKESSTNRLLSSNSLNWDEISGFYIDLVNTEDGNTNNYGERQVVASTVLGTKVSFVTLIPGTDPCVAGGTGWYMELNLYTGQTWDTGTEVEDDPSTTVDESEEIPTDSSNQFLDGVATGLSSVASVTTSTETITNEDGTTEEVTVFESAEGLTCITLSTNKQTCFEDDLNITGPVSWRQLY
ncbi:fimbrial assembly protein [Psychromonas sp. B3M02]|nr:fimbrial assembly protein [Psychromonas sp. B3M02]